MIVRPLRPDDIPACLTTIAECWGKRTAHVAEPELRDAFAGGAYRPTFYVAETLDGAVGLAGYNASWSGWGLYTLCWIGVRPSYRRHGFAHRLIDRCLADLNPIANAIMLTTDVPDFYRSWRFAPLCKVPSNDGESDTLMVRGATDLYLGVLSARTALRSDQGGR